MAKKSSLPQHVASQDSDSHDKKSESAHNHSHFSSFLTTWLLFFVAISGIAFYGHQEIESLKEAQSDESSPLDGRVEYLEDKVSDLESNIRTLQEALQQAAKTAASTNIVAEEESKPEETVDIEPVDTESETSTEEEDVTDESSLLLEEIDEQPAQETLALPSAILPEATSTTTSEANERLRSILLASVELKELIANDQSYGHVVKGLLPLLKDEKATAYAQDLLAYANQKYSSFDAIQQQFTARINDVITAHRKGKEALSWTEKLSVHFSKLIQIRKVSTDEESSDDVEAKIAQIEQHIAEKNLTKALETTKQLEGKPSEMLEQWRIGVETYLKRQQAIEQFYTYVTTQLTSTEKKEG